MKTWNMIGIGAIIGLMTAVSPVMGQPVSPEMESGDPPVKRERSKGVVSPGNAQKKITPSERREKVRKRVETIRILRLTEELGLDEETTTRLVSRIREIEKERWVLIKERRNTQRDLRKASHSADPDNETLKLLMESLEKNQADLTRLGEKERKTVKELLTPQQQAKYVLFQDRFKEEMKERIQKARKDRSSKRLEMNRAEGSSSP